LPRWKTRFLNAHLQKHIGMINMASIKIKLWGAVVGVAYWEHEGQCAIFQYDPDYLAKGYEVAPRMMPLSTKIYSFNALNRDTFNGLPGLISDSLPDAYGDSLIELWLRRNNLETYNFTPVDRLCYIGNRGMGALEYEPAMERAYVDNEIDINLLSALASDIMNDRMKIESDLTSEGISDLIKIGTSAGGMRAKAVIALNESTNDVRSGQIDPPPGFTHWLLKFDTEDPTKARKGYCRIEYAYYLMASQCKIKMTECRLLELGNKAHFMTKRFDRPGSEKIHVQTLCAMAHYDYKIPGAYSYKNVFEIIRELEMPYEDSEQLFRRMVFNVIAMNRDDHTKNLAFMMEEGKTWRLAPAYDMTYAYDPTNKWISRHQLSINGRTDGITMNDLFHLGKEMNIRNVKEIIETTTSIVSEWNEFAKSAGVQNNVMESIEASLKKNIDAM